MQKNGSMIQKQRLGLELVDGITGELHNGKKTEGEGYKKNEEKKGGGVHGTDKN
jgi:hypothetical protein